MITEALPQLIVQANLNGRKDSWDAITVIIFIMSIISVIKGIINGCCLTGWRG